MKTKEQELIDLAKENNILRINSNSVEEAISDIIKNKDTFIRCQLPKSMEYLLK